MNKAARKFLLLLALLVGGYLGLCQTLSWADPPVAFSHQEIVDCKPQLPPSFLLGTATAAHQVEGGNDNNDWAAFEKSGRIAPSGPACDHWNRVPQDIKLMREAGANAYRFSIEWSRLEPSEGVWDDSAWEHYQQELKLLRQAGIEPMVTLLHFTLPQWLSRRGGLTATEFPERFGRFAAEAARRLGPEVRLWCTLNEPNVEMLAGYVDGGWPPNKRDPSLALEALRGLLYAHARAARALHQALPNAQVGVAMNLVLLEPDSRWSLLDWSATHVADQFYNWTILDAIQSGRLKTTVPGWPSLDEVIPDLAGSSDYLGMNYYTRSLIRFSPASQGMLDRSLGPGQRTDMNWEIYPEGLLRLLRSCWKRYQLPIYITENGIADAQGDRREHFLKGHLYALTRALAEGIPVRGYFYWSLLDNFEWAEGFRPRFGLYSVDFKTFRRSRAAGWETFRAWSRQLKGQ